MKTGVSEQRFDIVVIGAGTTGAAAAGMLAEVGYHVALVEARPLDEAGARWINDIPPWMFDRAGIARPEPPERHIGHRPLHMFGNDDRVGLSAPQRPMWGIDCRHLVARLQADGQRRGVEAHGEVLLEAVECDGDRPRVAILRRRGAGLLRLRADLFVDASGINGALRKRVPALAAICPAPRDDELVSAVQQICVIRDRHGAETFLERLGVETDAFLTWTGVEGGYSTRVVRVAPDLSQVDLLTGVLAPGDPAGGMRLMQSFVRDNPWIGEPELSGASLIAVRRPYDRTAVRGAVLIGDAACHTFPAHGSGVGAGLIAARTLVESIRFHSDPGGEAATWQYQAALARDRGAVAAAYDVFRRLVQRMGGREVATLLDVGLMSARSVIEAMDQHLPSIGAAELLQTVRGLVRAPGPAARFGPSVARMLAAHAIYRRYPRRANLDHLRSWSRRAAAITGQRPDLI